ncbi:MAG: hypothetical protein JSV22_04185 [Bacteroidales bacterium]|nr:MAG: hypothetical protein JSV22_04185 [Bacteroidales bacterium]
MKLSLPLMTLGIIALLTSSRIEIYPQEAPVRPSIGRGSIESQFNYVLYRSEKYEDFKMVKAWWLYTLKAQVLDTLKALHSDFRDSLNLLSVKKAEIDSLTKAKQALNDELEMALKEKSSIKLLGIKTDKVIYNSIMWLIIATLLVFLIIFIIFYKRSHAVTASIKSELDETREEYEDYRKRALVREQQVVRELYDEILKYKNKLNL